MEVGKELKKRVQSGHVQGESKIYHAEVEGSAAREPDKHIRVALTVEEALKEAAEHSERLLNAMATSDRANTIAKADLIVGGKVLVADVPVSHLLWLRNYLGQWKGFLEVLPVLNPTRNWHAVEGRRGLYKSDPEHTARFDKEPASLVLVPPTDKHPGQAQAYQKETRVGYYENLVFSGAITEDRKKQLLQRVETLIQAVEEAKARANHTPTEADDSEGGKLLGFLLG